MAKKQALGRGLSALLGDADIHAPSSLSNEMHSAGIAEVDINSIVANPNQPRTHFDQEALQELADSIQQHGLVQPITLRKITPNRYQIISGERRYRASILAGLASIPAYVRQVDDEAVLELALIENIQREDLDAMEIAISYKRMIDELHITQEELAAKVSKNRTTVTNFLRLLNLPAEIQLALRERTISMGHARALLTAKTPEIQMGIFQRILKLGLNVRQVEQLVKTDKVAKKTTDSLKKAELTFEQQSNYLELQRIVHNKIDIKKDSKGHGKIIINFTNDDDLSRVLDLLLP
jgi:ParB family chromosome partitioning protein